MAAAASLWAWIWLASVPFEALNFTIGGKPIAFLRSAETGLTLSASCRSRAGRLACQAFGVLADASRRSAESSRHGVGGVDCGDFQAARVDPAERQPLCRFADGSMIRLEDLERYAQAKDDWEQSLSDPVTQKLRQLSTCLERVRYASVGTLRASASADEHGQLVKPRVARPKARGTDWPLAERCLLAALAELRLDPPPAFAVPDIELDLLLGGEPRIAHIGVHWKMATVNVPKR